MNRGRFVALSVVLLTLSACATSSRDATRASEQELERGEPTTTTTSAARATNLSDGKVGTFIARCDPHGPNQPTKSLAPLATLPRPGAMPAGSFMYEIVRRRTLTAGVDENTLFLSYRNPRTAQFEGFEIDVLREIARAIFGDPDKLTPIPVVTDEKVSVVADHQVDLTMSAVSMTCKRWHDVLFSMPYYRAYQRVQVRTDRQGRPVFADGSRVGAETEAELQAALKGRAVCATKGSTSADLVSERFPTARLVTVPTRPDCLMKLQDGAVDAIVLHDTFLFGFAQQDPNTAILRPELAPTEYGIAIGHEHPEFVRFVNRVLLDLRARGVLQQIYEKHFVNCAICARLHVDPNLPIPQPAWIE